MFKRVNQITFCFLSKKKNNTLFFVCVKELKEKKQNCGRHTNKTLQKSKKIIYTQNLSYTLGNRELNFSAPANVYIEHNRKIAYWRIKWTNEEDWRWKLLWCLCTLFSRGQWQNNFGNVSGKLKKKKQYRTHIGSDWWTHWITSDRVVLERRMIFRTSACARQVSRLKRFFQIWSRNSAFDLRNLTKDPGMILNWPISASRPKTSKI